ncbi:MAG: hypothetical protein ACLTC4_05525 [Hungatella hathewayi]
MADSIYGPWTRREEPILRPRPEYFDNMFVSNPAPYQPGRFWSCWSTSQDPIAGRLTWGRCTGIWPQSGGGGFGFWRYRAVTDEPLFPEGCGGGPLHLA